MRSRASLFAAAVICLLFSSCSHQIIPEKPVLASSDFNLDSLPSSEINIPVQINLKPVFAMAERSVDTVFTSTGYPDGWIQEGCDTRYKYIFRRGPLQMKASGLSLDIGFTGYYKISGSTRVCVNGAVLSPWTPACTCGEGKEGERRVQVSYNAGVSMQPDYKIRMNVKRNEPKPLDKCEVCFWGQNITGSVMKGLSAELDASKDAMMATYGLVDLRPRFQQIWDRLNQVYDVYGLGWLQLNPQQMHINNIYAKNDSLNVFLGMSAKPVIRFEKPETKLNKIPSITGLQRNPGFNIFLDAVLQYDSLSRLLNMQVAGKQFDLNKGPVKKTFIVNSCRLYGAGNEKLIIKVEFSGSDKGVLYLTGKPVYDKETRILEVKDVDYDIHSKAALLKAADWLFSKRITNEIGKYARYDLSAYIDSAKVNINQQLNREWMPGIRSTGNISMIRLAAIYPLSNYLVIRSNCTGDLSVKVDAVPFSL